MNSNLSRLAMVLAVSVFGLCLAAPAYSQNPKLIVKDTNGLNTVFSVDDTGAVGSGLTAPNYNFDLTSQGILRSSMHFSMTGSNTGGGWITSANDNNFFLSSGIVYDNPAGGWIQKSSDQKSVIAGSSSTRGYSIFLQDGCTAGSVCPVNLKFQVAYNGNVGIGVNGPIYPLQVFNGAYLSAGGVWENASSRTLKKNIKDLSSEEAIEAFTKLNPVTFNYKVDNEKHVGFIAEDVPSLVATKDRKALSSMDIVAVLTKVVQEQQKTINELSQKLNKLQNEINSQGMVSLNQGR